MPPGNREAERGVLCSMLRDNSVIPGVLQILRPEYFYTDAHQKIYDAIINLHGRRQPVDLVILADLLKERQHLEDVGGYLYIGKLWEAAPTAVNARHYAEIVRDNHARR